MPRSRYLAYRRRPDWKSRSSWWLTVNFCRGAPLGLVGAAGLLRLGVVLGGVLGLLDAAFRGLDLVFVAMLASLSRATCSETIKPLGVEFPHLR